MPADRRHRPRQHVRRLRLLEDGDRRRHQADHRHRGVRHARHPPRRQDPRALGQPAERRRRLGLGRLHAHDPARRDDRGHAQPVPAVVATPRSRATTSSRAWTASCCRRTRRASSRRPAAPAARCRPACGSGSTTRPRRRRPPSSATSSARTTSSPRSWTTASASSAASWTTCCGSRRSSTCRSSPRTTCTTRTQHDAKSHAALLCVQSGSTLDDPNRFKFDGDEFYLKTAGRRCGSIFRDHPEACDNTLLIAERCDVAVRHERELHAALPGARRARPRRAGSSRRSSAASHVRYPDGIPDEVRAQADYETGVIVQMGFPGYFLVVADFINWAKDERHPGRARPRFGRRLDGGVRDAASPTSTRCSTACIFERFLNPDRVSMPDFDVDFDDRRRGEVIQYVTEKYGDERVAQIVTYGTIKAKQALKDAGRVLGFPFGMGEKLTKAMPPAGHGQGHAARGHVRQGPPALQGGRRVPRPHRDRRRGEDGLRHRASASRTSSASGACTPPASSCRASR